MPELLHVKTIIIFMAIGNTLAAILVLLAVHKRTLHYDFLFMISLAVQGAGLSLIFLRGIIPYTLSFSVGNSLYLGGMVAEGVCLLSLATTVTKRWRLAFTIIFFAQLLVCWAPALKDTFRICVGSILLGCCFGIPAIFLIFFAARPSILQKFLGTTLAFCSFFTIVRGGFFYFISDYNLITSNFLQIVSLLTQALAMFVAITGYILTHWEFLYKDLELLASTDPLTGVPNRRTFFDNAKQELNRSVRHNHCLAFMMIDVDHFKNINDNYGHHNGDNALKALTSRSKNILRSTDFFGRLGGEEFGIIMPEISKEQAVIVAERLRCEIAEMEVNTDQNSFQITVSIGVTMQTATDKSLEEIMQRADSALYTAKKSGRNKIVIV
ncbi:GGDEF domain-containing protein [Maridesulfovibrio sp.]|uniref:GGDEF domain-containing protein n=1 Tax=Maridesulfovibrio sp. TaxID=2795000 RepID=UPI0039EE394C